MWERSVLPERGPATDCGLWGVHCSAASNVSPFLTLSPGPSIPNDFLPQVIFPALFIFTLVLYVLFSTSVLSSPLTRFIHSAFLPLCFLLNSSCHYMLSIFQSGPFTSLILTTYYSSFLFFLSLLHITLSSVLFSSSNYIVPFPLPLLEILLEFLIPLYTSFIHH